MTDLLKVQLHKCTDMSNGRMLLEYEIPNLLETGIVTREV